VSADLQEQFIRDMLTESFEGLDRYDRAILLLEKGSADRETLNDIFRVIHTLKGTAGCLGFHRIEKISHAGENLLDALRNEKLAASAPIAASLLRLSDNLRALLQSIENTGGDKTDTDHSALIAELTALRDGHHPRRRGPPRPPDEPRRRAGAGPQSNPPAAGTQSSATRPWAPSAVGSTSSPPSCRKRDEDAHAADRQRVEQVPPRGPRPRARLRQAGPRLEMEGGETELDRTIIEAIKDPLTHVIRNCVDHGIEAPAARSAAGKAPEGTLTLRAFHEGGRSSSRSPTTAPASTSTASARRPSERGLVTAERAERMSDREPRSSSSCPASPPPSRSPTSRAAASAWTWSRPTSRRSAAASTCTSAPASA
jgi:two-component system chemotaxis sensor kinase CheA